MSTCGSTWPAGLSRLVNKIKAALVVGRAALRSNDERARVQRVALIAFAIRIVSAGLAYFSQVAIARWMGSFEYGIFVFVWVWVLVLGGLASLGLNVGVIRFVPEHTENGDLDKLRGILLASRGLTFVTATSISSLAFVCLWLAPELVEPPYLLPAFLALFCIPLYALSDINDCVGRAYGWINLALLPPFVLRPFLLLLFMFLAHLTGFEMIATTAVGCAIVATLITSLTQHLFITLELQKKIESGKRTYEVELWLRASLPLVMILGFELLLQNTDVLVISYYMSPSDVGVYFAALKTISLVAFVHFAVAAAVGNRFSALNARGDKDGLRCLVRDASVWTFWPSMAGAIVLLALGKPLLWLFGSDFTDAYGVMFVLAAGLVVRATMGPAEYILNMLGEQKLCAMILFAGAGLNLVLNFLMVPMWGLYGAAAATSVSLAGSAILFYLGGRRRLGLDISIWPTLRARALQEHGSS